MNIDIYDLDIALAEIIHPTLLEYKENGYSSFLVDNEDVPDDTNKDRCDYVIDKIIEAFRIILCKDLDCSFNDNKEVDEGLRLFGKYFRSLDTKLAEIIYPALKMFKENEYCGFSVDNEDVPEEIRISPEEMKKLSYDGSIDSKYFERSMYVLNVMIKAFETIHHKSGESDIDEGLRLFGKYFRSLWI